MTLKQLRVGKDLSQDRAAELIGVSRTSVSKWEHGAAVPRWDNIDRMCSVYGCTAEDIFYAVKLAKSK